MTKIVELVKGLICGPKPLTPAMHVERLKLFWHGDMRTLVKLDEELRRLGYDV